MQMNEYLTLCRAAIQHSHYFILVTTRLPKQNQLEDKHAAPLSLIVKQRRCLLSETERAGNCKDHIYLYLGNK